MHCETVAILLRIRVRGHFVVSIAKNRESHYVTVLDNPRSLIRFLHGTLKCFSAVSLSVAKQPFHHRTRVESMLSPSYTCIMQLLSVECLLQILFLFHVG